MDYFSPRNNMPNQVRAIRDSYKKSRAELGKGGPTLPKEMTIEKATPNSRDPTSKGNVAAKEGITKACERGL